VSSTSVRVKFICRLGYGDALPKDEEFAGDVAVFGSNGQYATTRERNTNVPAIVLGRKGSYGKVNWAPEGCFASDTTFFVDDRFTTENLRWLYWNLQSLGLDKGSQEAAVPGINRESVYEERICHPKLANQVTVAKYLDREIARIDGLITEKVRMLALLEEKRAALISRVVTQGLDPDALVKASGHAWLGEIPTHWEAIRIKLITASLDQGSSPIAANTPAATDELGVLKLSAVTKGRFKREENKALRGTDHEEHLLALRKGDVLITRGNTPDLVADVACVPEDEPNLLLPDLIYRLRVKEEKILAEYLTAFLTTAEARFQIRRDARGSSGSMVKVSQGHVLDWLTPLPPLFEQVEIMNYLRRTEERFQSIAREVSSSLSLLSDRRAALISAAVTGQIPLEEMT
jgi:type I restriction enzyme S subunit